MAYADANIIIGTSVDVGGISTGLHNIEKSFKRLSRVATLAIGVKALTSFGKAALNAASDLQEVQNVVDVSFQRSIGTVEELGDSVKDMGYVIRETKDGVAMYVEDMSYKIEQMASTAIESYGMSRYQAKQTGGSFMAMGKAMGLTMEQASDMAVTLTKLSGDFASFHNISQEYARVALSAVYTGETETLKRYGVVLTEANLQEYANTLGIQTKVKAMDASSKALLRYKYILEATKDVEGDYVRTQDSWANQTRLLKNLWTEFLIVMGNGLSAVFAPMIKVINQIIVKLTQFASTLWQIIGNIFNLTFPGQEKKFANMASGINDTSEAVDGLGDSITKAGKKAKKQLANFDELNNITTRDTDGGAGGGAGLDIDTDELGNGFAGLFDPKAPGSPWAEIDTLYELGRYIGGKLSEMLVSIDWEKVYDKARNFGVGLAQFLNGLISTDLFWQVGRTIANSLNTAIYAALYFGLDFDWKQLGLKLAFGVNSFFEHFDFASLAKTINTWVLGIWDTIVTFFQNLNYKEIFKGIYDFISNLDPDAVMLLIGFFALKGAVKAMFSALSTFIAQQVIPFLAAASRVIAPIAVIVGGIMLLVKNVIDMVQNGVNATNVLLALLGVVIGTIGAIILTGTAGVPLLIGLVVSLCVGIAALIIQYWDKIKAVLSIIISYIQGIITTIGTIVTAAIQTILNIAFDLIKGAITTVVNLLSGIISTIASILNAIYSTIVNVVKAIVTGSTAPLGNILTAWVNVFNSIKNTVLGIFNGLWGGIKGVINSIISGINTMANGVINGINTVIRAMNSIPAVNINIPTVGNIHIPHLAKGAVIPPNKEFMAVLGDQKSGTNIEAPLDTIKQALMETMQAYGGAGGGEGDIVVQIDGAEVFRAVRKQSKMFTTSTGLPAF